jgi:hypothetical protein
LACFGSIVGEWHLSTQIGYGKTVDVHDIAVSDVTVFKTVVGQNYTMRINVTVQNLGTQDEIFNLTAYANETSFSNLADVSLPSGNSSVILFVWNATGSSTSGFVYGNYTISAYADPLLGETNTENNNFTCTTLVHVGTPGDCSGTTPGVYNRLTDIKDIAYMIAHFNGKPGKITWDPNADTNDDNVINIRDIAIAVVNFNLREIYP